MIFANTNTIIFSCVLYIVFLCFCFQYCSCKDNITIGESIDGTTKYLESAGKKFQMGFFRRPMGSERQYLGIWYAMDPQTVVWVANREQPMLDSFVVLTTTDGGEVVLLNKDNKTYFNFTTGQAGGGPQTVLKLLDSGNAVLLDTGSEDMLWQSFSYPTDTFLPGMNMDSGVNLTSWKNVDDPSPGSYMFQKLENVNQYVIRYTGSPRIHWKSGLGLMQNFEPSQVYIDVYNLLTNFTTQTKDKNNCILKNSTARHKRFQRLNPLTQKKKNSTAHTNITIQCNTNNYVVFNNHSRLIIDNDGSVKYFSRAQSQYPDWEEPENDCSVYGVCGKFALCHVGNQTTCSCLDRPQRIIDPKDASSDCKLPSDIGSPDDLFINVSMIKVENPSEQFIELENRTDCENKCLQNSDCKAYSYSPANQESKKRRRPEGKNRCWMWNTELSNLQTNGTHNISVRVSAAAGPLNENSSSILRRTPVLIITMTILVILLLCSLGYIYYKRLVTREQERSHVLQTGNSERWAMELLDIGQSRDNDTESIGIPFYQFEAIQFATDNFSDANKLGQGGFGSVYKGMLPGGLEVAVKRLSSLSGQGLEEFRNEVILIAKLQHRNLVRLLGYCMKGNEKILVYEYMRNKSLDAFIFDQSPSIYLDWEKRYEIIIGIARGLLYLHQDSRLRIIHRDLKTSNILLDEELNPKISDFGLAKIVQGRDLEASTNRVIGTYGYMAPEYALDGFFSIKSDVFSFGVVVLEILSGKKNTGSHQFHQSLLGYTWNLWKQDTPFELMDQRLLESSNSSEVLKCIIIGLLCVQEDPGDRPTMTNVVLMLSGDIASLPTPKQPAFVTRKTMSNSSSSSYKPDQTQTNNTLTLTLQEGR